MNDTITTENTQSVVTQSVATQPLATKPQVVDAPKASAQPKAKRILSPVQPKVEPTKEQPKVVKYTKLLDNNRMETRFTVKENEDATEELAVTVVFDYRNVSREELLDLATASTRISLQSRLRKMSPESRKAYASKTQTIDVKGEIVAAARQQSDPTATAIRALTRATGCSDEEARAIIVRQLAKKH